MGSHFIAMNTTRISLINCTKYPNLPHGGPTAYSAQKVLNVTYCESTPPLERRLIINISATVSPSSILSLIWYRSCLIIL